MLPVGRGVTHRWLRAGALSCAVGALAVANPARAQSGARAAIPVRTTTRVASSDSGVFARVTDVRHLPDNRVIVNDAGRKRLVVLDGSLGTPAIVAGVGSSAPNDYGGSATRLLPYAHDSAVLVNPALRSLSVFNAAGKLVRVMAVPRASDVPALATNIRGTPAFDPSGRLFPAQWDPKLGIHVT